jgi:hypothetical protein
MTLTTALYCVLTITLCLPHASMAFSARGMDSAITASTKGVKGDVIGNIKLYYVF